MNRPAILLGHGAERNPALVAQLASMGVPVLLTWMAADLLPEDHPAFCGRPGILGQRAANIILQKCTDLYVFGARLDEQTVNYNYEQFAPQAIKHVFDADRAELDKFGGAGWRVEQRDLTGAEWQIDLHPDPDWLPWCKALYARFRPEIEGEDGGEYVDPFAFVRYLSDACREDDVIALGSSGFAATVMQQAFKFKQGQKLTFVSTIGAMGADVPMAIGACIATGRRTICVTGDGGFQLNAQELEVARRLNLPIVFFVWNNNGYASIRNMQNNRFEGRKVAADPESGFTVPELEKLAKAYGLAWGRIRNGWHLDMVVTAFLNYHKPQIVEVLLDPAFQQFPRCGSTLVDGRFVNDPLHDMTPHLPDDELSEIMRW